MTTEVWHRVGPYQLAVAVEPKTGADVLFWKHDNGRSGAMNTRKVDGTLMTADEIFTVRSRITQTELDAALTLAPDEN
jgi:hypothetical protein